ncbi:MAG: hypothetical protein H0T79_01495 [Deltaproteobacteria bacterium]|nr:hypothetical protein [Deltaproteobacteria bacterium]
MTAREWLGNTIGAAWAPTIGLIAQARHARLFHPEGIVLQATIEPVDDDPLGVHLAGNAIGRFSAALWKRAEYFDVLGFALRIRPPASRVLDEHPVPGDQDLLFATIRSPFTMGLSPFTTHAGDFLANRYYAVSPFAIPPTNAHVKLRLVPIDPPSDSGGSRAARLSTALAENRADLSLEMRPTFAMGYRPIARVRLAGALPLDQQQLRFDPFRDGRDVVPVGLVHAIRRNAYAASRAATTALRSRPRSGEAAAASSADRSPRTPDLHSV